LSTPSPPLGRPTVAFSFGLVGGILIIACGAIFSLAWWGWAVPGIFGMAFGIIVLIGSGMLYAQPKQHVAWGIIVLIFSILSIVGFGGFIAGMTFGIVGGALGIAWGAPRPSPYMGPYGPSYAQYTSDGGQAYAPQGAPAIAPYASPYTPGYGYPPMGPWAVPVMQWRMCTGCGRWIPWAVNVCPLCGTQAPVAPWAAPLTAPAATGAPSGPAPFAVAPPPTPPAPEPILAPCPTCDADAEWLPLARKWFCKKEYRYF